MDYQFNKKSQGSADTKKSKRYVLNRIITPTGIAFWTVVAVSYIGDRFFHVSRSYLHPSDIQGKSIANGSQR